MAATPRWTPLGLPGSCPTAIVPSGPIDCGHDRSVLGDEENGPCGTFENFVRVSSFLEEVNACPRNRDRRDAGSGVVIQIEVPEYELDDLRWDTSLAATRFGMLGEWKVGSAEVGHECLHVGPLT